MDVFTDDKWQEHFTSIGNPYTIDVLYHSKSLFAKVGNKEHFPVEFEGGIQMSAQFGGDQYIAGQKEPVIDMPTRFVDFMLYWFLWPEMIPHPKANK